jgi:hypothetical protein
MKCVSNGFCLVLQKAFSFNCNSRWYLYCFCSFLSSSDISINCESNSRNMNPSSSCVFAFKALCLLSSHMRSCKTWNLFRPIEWWYTIVTLFVTMETFFFWTIVLFYLRETIKESVHQTIDLYRGFSVFGGKSVSDTEQRYWPKTVFSSV